MSIDDCESTYLLKVYIKNYIMEVIEENIDDIVDKSLELVEQEMNRWSL